MYILLCLSSLDLGSVSRMEETLLRWNKFLQPLLRLAGSGFGPSEELECYDLIGFACPSLISVDVGIGGGSGRYAYQLVTEKPGWFLLPTCLGGLVLRWVVSSFGEPEFWVDLVAPALWFLGEVMADGHLQPGHSMFLRYVDDFDILLLEAIKNYVSSSARGRTSSCWKLRSPVTRAAGLFLQELSCIFSISQGCLCKNVNFENHM